MSKKLVITHAFTLVELLVVISVISMLSSVIIVNVQSARAKSRDAVREQQLRQIDNATQMYIQDKGHAPYLGAKLENGTYSEICKAQSIAANVIEASACFAVSTAAVGTPQGDAWLAFKDQISEYMPNIPDDPCPTCDNDFGYLGYTYVAPLALQQQCGVGCAYGPEYFNQTYGLYVPLETTNTVSGNTNSGSAEDMSDIFGTSGAGDESSTNELTVIFTGTPTDQAYVTIDTGDVDTCSASDDTCVFEYDDGIIINASVSYTDAEEFIGWTDSLCDNNALEETCSFYLNSDRTIVVDFREIPVNIDVPISFTGSGNTRIQIEGQDQWCYPASCIVNLITGNSYTIVAIPNMGNYFTGWSGVASCSTSSSCTFVATDSMSIGASFLPNEPIPIINVTYSTSGTPSILNMNWNVQNAVRCVGTNGGTGPWNDINMTIPIGGPAQVNQGTLVSINCTNLSGQSSLYSQYANLP